MGTILLSTGTPGFSSQPPGGNIAVRARSKRHGAVQSHCHRFPRQFSSQLVGDDEESRTYHGLGNTGRAASLILLPICCAKPALS
jgi:hypothetical protein